MLLGIRTNSVLLANEDNERFTNIFIKNKIYEILKYM